MLLYHECGVVWCAESVDHEARGLHVVGRVQRLELQVTRPHWSNMPYDFSNLDNVIQTYWLNWNKNYGEQNVSIYV